MLKLIPLTALALGLSSGVALADHRGGDHRGAVTFEHRAPAVRDHRDWHGSSVVVRGQGGWYGGGRAVRSTPYYRNSPSYYRGHSYGGYVRRPIYVSRPIIRERYYNYYRRPAIIVEDYGTRPGYYWVAGRWTWTGYEWQWQPGHFEPDPNYIDPAYGAYYDGYDGYDGY